MTSEVIVNKLDAAAEIGPEDLQKSEVILFEVFRLYGVIDTEGEMPVIASNRHYQIDNMCEIGQSKADLLRFLLQNIRQGVQQQFEQHVIMGL